jgi:hypothetical protein
VKFWRAISRSPSLSPVTSSIQSMLPVASYERAVAENQEHLARAAASERTRQHRRDGTVAMAVAIHVEATRNRHPLRATIFGRAKDPQQRVATELRDVHHMRRSIGARNAGHCNERSGAKEDRSEEGAGRQVIILSSCSAVRLVVADSPQQPDRLIT